MPFNESEFPLMMSMLISPDIPVPPPNLSVLGNFCLLHGMCLGSLFLEMRDSNVQIKNSVVEIHD